MQCTPTVTFPLHTAFHGNAFNPDTCERAKYAELSKSSDGLLWQQADTAKIHCLAQGMAAIPMTNGMFYILVLAIPHGHHATYLHIVFPPGPKRPYHIMCIGLSVATMLNTYAM